MNRHIIQSRTLSSLYPVIHGYSDKSWGDMRETQNREAFLIALGLSADALVWQKQIHGIRVYEVHSQEKGTMISDTDALVYAYPKASRNSVCTPVLSVHTADCVPILLADPIAGIIAAVHAGWRGTVQGIVQSTVLTMVHLGAKSENIRVGMGPHIGPCCYDVPKQRAEMFLRKKSLADAVNRKDNQDYVIDLGKANANLLLIAGVKANHIDRCGLCTSCTTAGFYSYRREKSEGFGEIMGVIGYKS